MVFFVSGLFYFVAFCCIMVGIYSLYINKNTLLNKLAFLFCSSFSCWCIGAANSLAASDYADSFLWRRFAAIGVGTFYSFFLHYIIILTNKNQLMKNRWIILIIYIPSIIIVYCIAFSTHITKQLYHLEKTSIGWINRPVVNIYFIIFDVYILSFMLMGLYMLYQWKKKYCNDKKKLANLIFISFLISFVVDVKAEILDHILQDSYFHALAPLVIILPIICFCYAITKYDFMKTTIVKEEKIFLERFRTKITKYLSLCFYAGGVIYLVSQYLYNSNAVFSKVIVFSCILFLFGFFVYMIQKYINDDFGIMLYSILLSVAIPIISIHFIQNATITIWAFPFVIVIATLLFYNSMVLIMVSTSMLLTQLFIWIKVPYCIATINTDDYLTRIGLMGMAIFLVYYINRIYLLRLSQLSDKIKTQDLLFLISSRIINVNGNNFKQKTDEVLNLLCIYLNADRAHVNYNAYQEDLVNTDYYYWCNEITKLDDDNLSLDASITQYSWWKKQAMDTGIIQIPDVSLLPEEAINEKEFLTRQDVKSLLVVPLISNGQKTGYLRLDFVLNYKKWDDEFIKLLTIIGNLLGEANIKASSEKKMEQLAYYDQLTNIPNRQLFGEHINLAIKNAGQSGVLIGIIFLDLDSFKIINDAIGHHNGDWILIMIANKLSKCLRKTDTVCRFGGDEFLIMLNDITSKKDIEAVIEKIIKQFEQPIFIEDQEFYITASVGISIFPADGTDKDTLIKNADIAMYKAKHTGKNQFVYCSQEMKDEIQQTMLLTNYLYHALERNEIKVVYQPQLSITTGKVIAIEALARWTNPELGIIPPSIFIPIAEHTGLINLIGAWILKEACRQNKIWQDMGLPLIRLAVNVSVNQLLNSNFSRKVIEILKETGLEARYLEIELTENIAIQESDFILDVLSELKAIGLSLALDDFGIEYSSLSRIKMLPIDRLKIDMHFISGILDNEKDRVIVDVIIKLAKDLRLKVIAEGVEKEEQLIYLKQKMCDEVQGYYFYKPLSAEDMQEVLLNI